MCKKVPTKTPEKKGRWRGITLVQIEVQFSSSRDCRGGRKARGSLFSPGLRSRETLFAHHVVLSVTGNLGGGGSSSWSLWSVWRLIPHPGSTHWIQWIVWGAPKLCQIHRSVKELHHKCVVESPPRILCFSLSLPDCFCRAAERRTICSWVSFQGAWKAASQRLSLRLWFLILIFSDCFLQSSW